jgi:DNA-binding NtrC family response regulator
MAISLNAGDREFFQWVAEAAFANPFGERRLELDLQIAGAPFRDDNERAQGLERAVTARVRQLSPRRPHLREFSGADRELMRLVFLFEAYHRIFEPLDQVILAQSTNPSATIPVPSSGPGLGFLGERGFAGAEGCRFFGIFFQIRRAYFFIHQGLIGESRCMRRLREQLWNTVFTHDIRWYDRYLWNRMEDFSTLLLGETGAGKGAAAAAIGRSGYIPFDERKGVFMESFMRSFVALNLSQFPETLIESELFGHRKGAFTGAMEEHQGIFARCSPQGSIFLDEIGDASVPVQIKLLQVLQERTFTPVGSHDKQRFRGRVIAATHRPLETLRSQRLFRDDFFYRLCSDVILVPPLRQRLEEDANELPRLVEHLVGRMAGAEAPELVALVLEVLRQRVRSGYAWPGNVRELEQAVRRILLTRDYAGDAPAQGRDTRALLLAGLDGGQLDADALLAGYCSLLHERHGTIEEVARRTKLDRRTVKRYLALQV